MRPPSLEEPAAAPRGVRHRRENPDIPSDSSSRAIPLPGLGTVTDDVRTGGVAYLARLVREALTRIAGVAPAERTLSHTTIDAVPLARAARYAALLAGDAVAARAGLGGGRPRWWVFDHVASAQPLGLLPGLLRLPYGVFIHDVEGWGDAMPARRRRTFQRATVRIANSHYTALRTEKAHPEIGAVTGCPLGLLPDSGDASGEPLACEREEPARDVLILGRISSATRYKGHDLLIESWAEISRAVPGARLLVAGDGDDVPRLRALAARHGVDDRVRFLGFVAEAELERLLHRVAFLAMPSTSEGFGLAYLRAMRAGAPSVAVRAGAVPEVVVHSVTGLLAEPGDRSGIVESIVVLLRDDRLRRAMGRAARQRYESEFTFEHFARRLERIVQPLIAHGRRT
jgi:phosphatidylinositol alpha-1,6-mannosyltransferase